MQRWEDEEESKAVMLFSLNMLTGICVYIIQLFFNLYRIHIVFKFRSYHSLNIVVDYALNMFFKKFSE